MSQPHPEVRLVPMPDLGPSVPRRGNAVTRWLARAIGRLIGWRVVGALPDLPKMVIIAAPHTTNWDFPLGILALYTAGFRVSFFGKDTLFRPPLGWIMRWLGGQPVDRSSRHGVVEDTVRIIRNAPSFVLALAPEGTRKRAPNWRTGFYHVAAGAGLPIVLGFFDYQRKEVGFGPPIWPSGDLEQDLERIQAFYRTKPGKYPANFATGSDQQPPPAAKPA